MQSHVLRDCGSYRVKASLHRLEKVARQLVRRVFREDRLVRFDAKAWPPRRNDEAVLPLDGFLQDFGGEAGPVFDSFLYQEVWAAPANVAKQQRADAMSRWPPRVSRRDVLLSNVCSMNWR